MVKVLLIVVVTALVLTGDAAHTYSAIDLLMAKQIQLGMRNQTDHQQAIFDMNGNGVVDLGDLELMKREVMR